MLSLLMRSLDEEEDFEDELLDEDFLWDFRTLSSSVAVEEDLLERLGLDLVSRSDIFFKIFIFF